MTFKSAWLPLLAALFTLIPSARAEEPPFIGLITGDGVSLRAGPGLAYEILQKLPKGKKIEAVTMKAGWYGVRLPPEVSVYVAKAFLRMEGGTTTVQGKRVRIRAGAGSAFTSLGFLEDRQEVRVRQTAGDWVEIQPPPDCLGWVHESYLTYLQPVEDPW